MLLKPDADRENYECNHEEGRRSVDDVLAAIQKGALYGDFWQPRSR